MIKYICRNVDELDIRLAFVEDFGLYPDDIDALIMNLNDFIMDLKVRLYGMDASEL